MQPIVLAAMSMHTWSLSIVSILMCFTTVSYADTTTNIYWPTGNKAFFEGKPLEAYIQPTVSGVAESGLFGLVRSNGYQFHGGLDLKPLQRTRKGEPKDTVFAVMNGTVVHINTCAGNSTYGTYIIIEHIDGGLSICSLYAHLASIHPGMHIGSRVQAGAPVGIMGRSANHTIPKDRAHLHFELGVRLGTAQAFNRWYQKQDFEQSNKQGQWNGMNLIAIDPLGIYKAIRSGSFKGFKAYLHTLPTAFEVIVSSSSKPEFIKRNPDLLGLSASTYPSDKPICGWRIEYTWFGFPKAWYPLQQNPMSPKCAYQIQSINSEFKDPAIKRRYLSVDKKGAIRAGKNLRKQLALLFDFKD